MSPSSTYSENASGLSPPCLGITNRPPTGRQSRQLGCAKERIQFRGAQCWSYLGKGRSSWIRVLNSGRIRMWDLWQPHARQVAVLTTGASNRNELAYVNEVPVCLKPGAAPLSRRLG